MFSFQTSDVTARVMNSFLGSHFEVKLVAVAMLAIAFTYWFYVQKQGQSLRKSLPPGPRSIPVLGNMHQVGRLVHQSMQYELSKKYGPLMYLRLGSIPTVVVSSSSMAKEVLKVHDQFLASRPRTAAAKYMLYDGDDILFAQYGPDWRLKKKICTLGLLTSKRLQEQKNVRMEEICALLKSIYEDSSITSANTVNVSKKFSAMGLNVISRMMLNKRVATSISQESVELNTAFEELLSLLGTFYMGDFIPYLAWFDPLGYKGRMKKIHQRLDSTLENIIHEHELLLRYNEQTEERPKDLLDVMLNLNLDGVLETHNLSRRSIKGVVLNMLLGGSDTSSHTLNWAMAELLCNPTLLKQAQIEIDAVVGDSRKVDECDLSELKFLHAIVKETFRLHPVVPLLVPHESMKTCEIGGYIIPEATRVYVNAWAIGRDPSVWQRALEFYPQRFVQESRHIDVVGNDYELLPFGSGRRRCPGIALGLCMVQHTLASLLHCFHWCLPDGQLPQDVDMQEAPGIVMPKEKDLILLATPRKVTHLYIHN